MEGEARRGRSRRERRLERRFEAERVEEELWSKVYEMLWPLVRLRNAEEPRPAPPRSRVAGRKGA